MTAAKALVKRMLYGTEPRPFAIQHGLLKGLNFFVDPREQTLFLTGLYEREIFPAVRRFASKAATAVDIGASDGLYTIFFAAQPGIHEVVACEPVPEQLRLLERNLALNTRESSGKVTIKPICVGGANNVDSLVRDCRKPLFLKIDVEGAEMEVLSGARKTLAAPDTMLVVETHSAALEQECTAFLKGFGYRCEIQKNAWYRNLIPEERPIPHNRWLIAERA